MMPEPILDSDLDQTTREHLARLKGGCVLLARENLLDPNFLSTVVLICVHNLDGAYGLVLNRPAHIPLSEIFDVDHPLRHERRKFYMGGPVQQDTLQILQVTKQPIANAHPVAPEVYLGGEWTSLEQILQADTAYTRLFLGYAGWGPAQLESEIIQGAWDVFTIDVASLLRRGDPALAGAGVPALRSFLASISC